MVWGATIAASHLLNAVKSYLPFGKRLEAASDLSSRFEGLFVRWEAAWQNVADGDLTADQIAERLFTLKRTKIELQEKCLKGVSLPDNPKLEVLAAKRAESYFSILYPREESHEDNN